MVKFPKFFGAPDDVAAEAWLDNMKMCFVALRIYLQHEGPHGSISTKGECFSMVEDALAGIEHGRRRKCHGKCLRNGFREVSIRGIH
jgi:hypothetical protein